MFEKVKDFVRLKVTVMIVKYIRFDTKNKTKFKTVHDRLFLALFMIIIILVQLFYFFDQVIYV